MARETPLLVKTFPADTAVSSAGVCLVMSAANAGNVALPGGALATKFAGVACEPVAAGSVTNAVAVQVAGIAPIQTDGSAVITAGDYVAIADTSGRIKAVTPASGTNVRQIVGIALNSAANTAGLLVDVLLQPTVYIGA